MKKLHYLLAIALVAAIGGCGLIHELKTTGNINNVTVGMTSLEVMELCGPPRHEVMKGDFAGLLYRYQPGAFAEEGKDTRHMDYMVVIGPDDKVIQVAEVTLYMREVPYGIMDKPKIDVDALCKFMKEKDPKNNIILCGDAEEIPVTEESQIMEEPSKQEAPVKVIEETPTEETTEKSE